jgi:nitroreductase
VSFSDASQKREALHASAKRREPEAIFMSKLVRTDHPIHELLAKRWSPLAFADRAVPADALRRLLEAARWAPSSYNEQPWAFIVATKDKPDEFQKLLQCLVPGNQTWAKDAPVLMLTVASHNFKKNQKPNRHCFHDVGLAMGNLCAQATAEGLYVHQMAGIEVDKARADYGYHGDPNHLPEQLQAREKAERTRKPLGDFVFANSWGATSSLV